MPQRGPLRPPLHRHHVDANLAPAVGASQVSRDGQQRATFAARDALLWLRGGAPLALPGGAASGLDFDHDARLAIRRQGDDVGLTHRESDVASKHAPAARAQEVGDQGLALLAELSRAAGMFAQTPRTNKAGEAIPMPEKGVDGSDHVHEGRP